MSADTLAAFFQLDDPARERAAAEALSHAPALRRQRSLARLYAPAGNAIAFSLKALLSDPVSGVLANAWSRWRQFEAIRTAAPDAVNEITLHEHEIALERKPSLELTLSGVPTGVLLQFELKLALTLTSALLKLRGRTITGAVLGEARGVGTISLGRATVLERKTAPFVMPRQVAFTPGVELQI